MILGAHTSATPSGVITARVTPPLERVIQSIAQDQNHLQIKKLLIYTCTQVWETGDRLNRIQLGEVLKALVTRAPSLDQLRAQLEHSASTLNKPAEYALIAQLIIQRVSPLYPSSSSLPTPSPQDYQTVAQSLAQDPNLLRIKKLLVFACSQTWETDAAKLETLNLLNTLIALRDRTPSLESLQGLLDSRIKTLSKPADYQRIAQTIIGACQSLYPPRQPSEAALALAAVMNSLPAQPAHLQAAQSSSPPSQSPHGSSAATGKSTQPPRDRANRFDLRLDIMQHTSAFRAKILLFSLLHEPIQDDADSMLKQHDLDDLLYMMVQTYKSYSSLKTRLLKTVQQLTEPSVYDQVAHTILRAVKPFYTLELAQPAQPAQPTPSVSDDIATGWIEADDMATQPGFS